MFEIEMKVPLRAAGESQKSLEETEENLGETEKRLLEMEERLLEIGFTRIRQVREEDCYFDRADGQIRDRGEALRVRKVTVIGPGRPASGQPIPGQSASGQSKQNRPEPESVITFKGKRLDTVSKSRRGLETAVGDAGTAMEIFEAIGFCPVSPMVVKTRTEYEKGRMNACLDHIDGLGDFLELEIVVEREEEKDAATGEITDVLARIGYSVSDSIRTSYLGLLQAAAVNV